MSFIRRRPGSRGARPVLSAVAAVVVLLLALAVPAGAVEGPTKLFDASVGPRTGTPTTTIEFSVTYRNREGSAPEYVRVLIDGTAHQMAGDGAAWKKGVVFRYATKLALGVHDVAFEAADTRKFSDAADGGSVTIEAPPPPPPPPPAPAPPPPTPAPTPAPKPAPTVAPDSNPNPAEPTPAATPPPPAPDPVSQPTATTPPSGGNGAGVGDTPTGGSPGDDDPPMGPGRFSGNPDQHDPVDGVGPGSSAGPGFGPAGPGPGSAGPDGRGGHGSGGAAPVDGTSTEGGTPAGANNSTDGGVATSDGTNAGSGGGTWGALAAALQTLGLGSDSQSLSLMATLVGTSGAVAMALAFAIFGKKRRDEEQPAPDEVLRAQAARGSGVASSGELVRAVVRNTAMPAPVDAESSMPRWRRPSLLEARKADPSRTVTASHRMSFEDSRVDPVQGYERRTIRYRVVRLLDAPDELRSADIGQLDQGDEVQLIERSGAYWLVLCPDGRQGWLHKMTLGDVVNDEPSPTAAEAWGGSEVDSDVLAAFLAARTRA